MRRGSHDLVALIAGAMLLVVISDALAQDSPSSPIDSVASLQQSIDRLSAAEFEQREQAQQSLVRAGQAALPHLQRALETLNEDDLEGLWRLQQTLVQIALDSEDPAVTSQVREVLGLYRGPFRATLAEAAAALGSQSRRMRSDRAVERLQLLGANVMVSGVQSELAMERAVIEGFAMRRRVRMEMIPGRLAIRAAAIPIQRPRVENKPEAPPVEPAVEQPNEERGQVIAEVEGVERAPIRLEQVESVEMEVPPDVEFRVQPEPIAQVPSFDGEDPSGVPSVDPATEAEAEEGAADASASSTNLDPAAAIELPLPVLAWSWISIRNEADLERWLLEDRASPMDPNDPWWTDENGLTHFDPQGELRRRAAGKPFNSAEQRMDLPVFGPLSAEQVEPLSNSQQLRVQRSIVIDELWKGTSDELRLLTSVDGLLFLQINGRRLEDRDVEAIMACTELQRLSINRCEFDYELMVQEISSRPGLMVDSTGTARMGIYGATTQDGEGCRVGEILAGSPAELAGLMPGDLILDINGQKIADFQQLALYVSTKQPGDRLEVMLMRSDGHREIMDVELAPRE